MIFYADSAHQIYILIFILQFSDKVWRFWIRRNFRTLSYDGSW